MVNYLIFVSVVYFIGLNLIYFVNVLFGLLSSSSALASILTPSPLNLVFSILVETNDTLSIFDVLVTERGSNSSTEVYREPCHQDDIYISNLTTPNV